MNGLVLVAAAGATLVGGCAFNAAGNTSNYPYDGIDTAKVTAINRVAHERGLVLRWVNYPQRRTDQPAPAVPTGT